MSAGPRSFFSSRNEPDLLLTAERAKRLVSDIVNATTGDGLTRIYLNWRLSGGVRWARNFAHTATESIACRLSISRTVRGATGLATTNRIDLAGVQEVVAAAERELQVATESTLSIMNDPEPSQPHLKPDIWSESTIRLDAAARSELARSLITPAEAKQYSSAGEIRVSAEGAVFATSSGVHQYYPRTIAECSMTVRNAAESASGWAGMDHHDWTKIDASALNAIAIEKCRQSALPKAVEPGRYTTILEPQAVADLVSQLFWDTANSTTHMARMGAEQGGEPFSATRAGYTKIGLHVIDSRLRLRSDPTDPDAGFIPFDFFGNPHVPVDWGIGDRLRELAYDRTYALQKLGKNTGLPGTYAFRLDGQGEPTSRDTMIQTTRRGLLVTRFSGVRVVDGRSLLCAGYTRDGVWLIENGKMSYPVKNFQIVESPIFMLNNIEQIGAAVRVLRPDYPTIAPLLKVRDFNFASLADAV